MDVETVLFLKMLAGLVTAFYGLWQHFEKRKLENFISNKAIAISSIIGIGLGAVQEAKRQTNPQNIMTEIGRAEGLLNAALIDSADIYCNLKKTTILDIEEFSQSNDTIKGYKDIFLKFSAREEGLIRRMIKAIKKLY